MKDFTNPFFYFDDKLNPNLKEKREKYDEAVRARYAGFVHPYTKKPISSALDFIDALESQEKKTCVVTKRKESVIDIDRRIQMICRGCFSPLFNRNIVDLLEFFRALDYQKEHNLEQESPDLQGGKLKVQPKIPAKFENDKGNDKKEPNTYKEKKEAEPQNAIQEERKMDLKYNIIKEIAVLSEAKSGWRKEINIISWNGASPKYDIRDWAPGHEKMGKGITLTEGELKKLTDVISEQNLNTISKVVSIDELTTNWEHYAEQAPESLREYLLPSHLNKANENTLMLCLRKGTAYKELLYRQNIECLEKYVEQLIGKYIRIEITESSWV